MMRILMTCLLLLVTANAGAIVTDTTTVPHFDDPAVRARYQGLTEQLRCVICLNQTIASSTAPLALDMRIMVAKKIRAGYSDAEIKAILVDRYGTFVLYKPPFSMATWALWLGPPVLLLLGLLIAVVLIRRQRSAAVEPIHLDQERLARVLAEDDVEEHHS